MPFLRHTQVDSLQKNSLFTRQQNLEKIMYEYDKTRSLMKERQDLQLQRKMANVRAAMQRQSIAAVSLRILSAEICLPDDFVLPD